MSGVFRASPLKTAVHISSVLLRGKRRINAFGRFVLVCIGWLGFHWYQQSIPKNMRLLPGYKKMDDDGYDCLQMSKVDNF